MANPVPVRGRALMQEENAGETYEAGLYRHPITGAEIATTEDAKAGNVMSEAVVRLGFVRVGDTPEGYAKTLPELNAEKSAAAGSSSEDLKGIQARISALESENAKLRSDAETSAQPAQPSELQDEHAETPVEDAFAEESDDEPAKKTTKGTK